MILYIWYLLQLTNTCICVCTHTHTYAVISDRPRTLLRDILTFSVAIYFFILLVSNTETSPIMEHLISVLLVVYSYMMNFSICPCCKQELFPLSLSSIVTCYYKVRNLGTGIPPWFRSLAQL